MYIYIYIYIHTYIYVYPCKRMEAHAPNSDRGNSLRKIRSKGRVARVPSV